MSTGLTPGETLPDFTLPDQDGVPPRLSELQGSDTMVLLLGRGEHCPRERQHQREMIRFHQWCAVGFTQLVTVLPNDLHDVGRLRISTGAYWPYLSDADLEVQRTLEIDEYTDAHQATTVPHALVLPPGLVVEKVLGSGAVPHPSSCGPTWPTCTGVPNPTSTPRPPRRGRPGPADRRTSVPGPVGMSVLLDLLTVPAQRLPRRLSDTFCRWLRMASPASAGSRSRSASTIAVCSAW